MFWQGFTRHHALYCRFELGLKGIWRREGEVRHMVPEMQVADDALKGPGLETRGLSEITRL